MARQVAPAGFHAVLARLDRAELAACRRFNSVVAGNRLRRTFRIASRLGDGVIWYTLIACSAVPMLLLVLGAALGMATLAWLPV